LSKDKGSTNKRFNYEKIEVLLRDRSLTKKIWRFCWNVKVLLEVLSKSKGFVPKIKVQKT